MKMGSFTAVKTVSDGNFVELNRVCQTGEAGHVLEIFTIRPVSTFAKVSSAQGYHKLWYFELNFLSPFVL